MVNEAYLNQLNAEFTEVVRAFTWCLLSRSADREVGEIDRLDPVGLRINHPGADPERDTVRNTAVLGVQPQQPGLTDQGVRQRPLPELEQYQCQGAAEQRGIDEVIQQVAEAEPERGGARNLGVAATDPSHRETRKSDRQHAGAGPDMRKDVVKPHAAQQSE